MVQFAFLFFVGFANFMTGVGAAVYLGKAPRDLRFLTELVDAMGRRKSIVGGEEIDPSISEDAIIEPPAAESATEVASTSSNANVAPAEDPSVQEVGLEEKVIDMSTQEVHLRQLGQRAFEDHGDALDWEELLASFAEDIQQLLELFNEARYLVEQERELAPDSSQGCLVDLDTQWNAINQQSMLLLVMSSDPDPTDAARSQLSTICVDVLKTSSDTRQSCAAFMENAALERQTVSA